MTATLPDILARRGEQDEIPEDLQKALERTKAYIAWQKRKQAEARGKTIITEGGK